MKRQVSHLVNQNNNHQVINMIELNPNKCQEFIPHFKKGQQPILEQCKRNIWTESKSQRCKLHSKNYKAPKGSIEEMKQKIIDKTYDCGCIIQHGSIYPCPTHLSRVDTRPWKGNIIDGYI